MSAKEHALPLHDSLHRGRLQRLQLILVMRRTEMLDVVCSSPRGVHDCTAVAPDTVQAARTYATDVHCEPLQRPMAGPRPRLMSRPVERSSGCVFHPTDTISTCEGRHAGRVDHGPTNGPALPEVFPTVLSARSTEPLPQRGLPWPRTPPRGVARAIRGAVVLIPCTALLWYVTRHIAVLTLAGHALTRADPAWSMLATGCAVAAFPAAVATLQIAANQPLPLFRTTQVELAGTFLNRITPNGIGRAVLSGRFLVTRGLRADAAVATVAATAAAGFLIHTSGIVITVSLGGARGLPHPPAVPVLELVSIAAVATVVAGGWVIYRRSNPARHIRIGIASVIRQLVLLARDRPRAMGVIAGTAAASIATVTAFWAAVNAIFAIGFLPAATIYLIGTAISNIAPSPAGVGVPEAALTAGLTMTGIPMPQALAGVLVFRLVSFWLPTLLGAAAWLHICHSKCLAMSGPAHTKSQWS